MQAGDRPTLSLVIQMDPSSSQQAAPAIKHMMTVPEKIELTSTGAYPSPPRGAPGQRGDYRAMRVPDKIMLETAGRGEGEGDGGSGGGVSGGYFTQPRYSISGRERVCVTLLNPNYCLFSISYK